MNHKYSHLLAGYWAGVYSQADRVALEDAVFTAITPNLFVSFGDTKDELRFVAAGSQVNKALGRIVGSSLYSLFGIADRPLIRKLSRLSWQRQEPLCFSAVSLRSDAQEILIEVSLFPIRQRDDQVNCFMGLFLPLDEIGEGTISLPLKLMMSQELSDVLTSEGATIVPFRGKMA